MMFQRLHLANRIVMANTASHSAHNINLNHHHILIPQVMMSMKNHSHGRHYAKLTRKPTTSNDTTSLTSNQDDTASESTTNHTSSQEQQQQQQPHRESTIPKTWRPDSPSLRNITTFTTASERGKNVSLTGRVYSDQELTPGLSELISQVPLLQFPSTSSLLHLQQQHLARINNRGVTNEEDVIHAYHALLTRAVTHKSFGTGKVLHNETMAFMGKNILNLYVAELCTSKYYTTTAANNSNSNSSNTSTATTPTATNGGASFLSSPTNSMGIGGVNLGTLKLIRSIYTNRTYLGSIVALKYWNIDPLRTIRCYGWHDMLPDTQKDILADVVYSLITVVYQTKGPSAANQFIEQELIKETPSNIFRQLLELKKHIDTFEDVTKAQLITVPRVIEERVGNNNYKCSYFNGVDLIGYATADTPGRARNLAALNGLIQMAAKLPQH